MSSADRVKSTFNEFLDEFFTKLYEEKYKDYSLFRMYLLKCAIKDVSWDITETNPLSSWMKELAPVAEEVYVSFDGACLYILDKTTYDQPVWVEHKGSNWHKLFLKSLTRLGKNQITAKEALDILDKVIALEEEIKKHKK